MVLEPIQYALGAVCGVGVGLMLGLIGGGGSVLAVPMMVYIVGVPNPHEAIGASAFAVTVNAAFSLLNHARAGSVKWRCGGIYAIAGIAGAALGSTIGKQVDGAKLLFLFALLMIAIGVVMIRGRDNPGKPDVQCTVRKAPKVIGYGLITGAFSGFFGIGGGFLIVPGLVTSTGMPLINAIGTSLIAVIAFGLTTTINYAASGLVDWGLSLVFILGGVAGAFVGAASGRRLAKKSGLLSVVFACVVFAVAGYMLFRTASAEF